MIIKNLLSPLLVLIVVCVIGTAGTAASTGEVSDVEPVADVMIGPSGINWLPKVGYAQLVLRVARPDGTISRKTFEGASTPYLDLSDIYGQGGCDGLYTYELRVIPVKSQKVRDVEGLSAAAPAANREQALTQSGSFRVQEGMILTTNSPESLSRTMDVPHYDDVIITGSLCVGFDCQVGEPFGYDVIKLKENNLRIFFEDTSNSPYPTNDWRILINDTTYGGAEHFSIEDSSASKRLFTIEAGAPANSLYVDDHGCVGLGTSVPELELHIVGGDTPGIQLHQDQTAGWPEQKWDVTGNETNFMIRDVTQSPRLILRIQSGAPTNSFCIRSDGKVGIGTWSPAEPLELQTTGKTAAFIANRTDGATAQITAESAGTTFGSRTNHTLSLVVNQEPKVVITPDGNMGIGLKTPLYPLHIANGAYCSKNGKWLDASSIRFKENIRSLTTNEAVDTLDQLRPVRFNYKVDKTEECLGFIAEEVPQLVASKGRKGLSPMDITAVLTRVLQEQQKMVREQQETIMQLKTKIAELEKKLD
ncbi:MAG: tail fiber domain-containing protein [Candidatus Aminicenantes bacterium]|nr:MAG: tail fiber domain-containing protein [Candidatus Aminicenantes bacterium]